MIRFEQKQPDGTVFLVKRRYEYDALYQLTREITDGTINYHHQWQYDCVGNRLKFIKHETGETIEYEYNAANQLLREISNINGVTEYQYNANGNMTAKIEPDGSQWRYIYDIEDMLIGGQSIVGMVRMVLAIRLREEVSFQTDAKVESRCFHVLRCGSLFKVLPISLSSLSPSPLRA